MLTVKQLIDRLEDLPQDALVLGTTGEEFHNAIDGKERVYAAQGKNHFVIIEFSGEAYEWFGNGVGNGQPKRM